jgi:hypothetical protein
LHLYPIHWYPWNTICNFKNLQVFGECLNLLLKPTLRIYYSQGIHSLRMETWVGKLAFNSSIRAMTIMQHCCFTKNTTFEKSCLVIQTYALVVRFRRLAEMCCLEHSKNMWSIIVARFMIHFITMLSCLWFTNEVKLWNTWHLKNVDELEYKL